MCKIISNTVNLLYINKSYINVNFCRLVARQESDTSCSLESSQCCWIQESVAVISFTQLTFWIRDSCCNPYLRIIDKVLVLFSTQSRSCRCPCTDLCSFNSLGSCQPGQFDLTLVRATPPRGRWSQTNGERRCARPIPDMVTSAWNVGHPNNYTRVDTRIKRRRQLR